MNSYAYYIYGVGHRTEDDAFMQVPGEEDLQSTYVSLRGGFTTNYAATEAGALFDGAVERM